VKKLLSWIRKNPQRTAGIIQVASGSILASLPTLGLSQRSMSITIAGFGLVQAVFGYLKSQADASPHSS
jgi:hypothetical protein